jgi:hypothetical protein
MHIQDNAPEFCMNVADTVAITPPGTPRGKPYVPTTPPPAPKEPPMPPLMAALSLKCAKRVEKALAADPDAAKFPFWDHAMDPPLCYAIRNRCNTACLKLLLEYGADPNVKDVWGNTPADILNSIRSAKYDPKFYADLGAIEKMLCVEVAVRPALRSKQKHQDEHPWAMFASTRGEATPPPPAVSSHSPEWSELQMWMIVHSSRSSL